jgi:hypothetical protein
MTPRERVIASLAHRQLDRTPWHVEFTEPARQRMAGMETILVAMLDDPGFVHALLDRILAYNLRVIDVVSATRLYGDRLSFYGGISTQSTLPSGSVQEIRDEVQQDQAVTR